MKLLFNESLSPKLVEILRNLFPESESALRNGLAGAGDLTILEYACVGGFVLVSTDTDFERLLSRFAGANVVILGSCNYPTKSLSLESLSLIADVVCFSPERNYVRWNERKPLISRRSY